MNDEVIEDLKQFISTTVGQSRAQLSQRLDALTKEVREGFAGVGDVIESHSKETDEQLADHEQRITSLEEAA